MWNCDECDWGVSLMVLVTLYIRGTWNPIDIEVKKCTQIEAIILKKYLTFAKSKIKMKI